MQVEMNSAPKRRKRRLFLLGVLGMLLLCSAVAGLSALSNLTLPGEPEVLDRLEPLDKARLEETLHLKRELGEAVWPGWGKADIPVLLRTREYGFLVGHSDPPAGWVPVDGDSLDGRPYYRHEVQDWQNFAVQVGDRWVASLSTKWAADAFVREQFQSMLPPVIEQVFPYRLLILPSEVQMTGVLHESFHVFQMKLAPERLQDAETAYQDDAEYWSIDPAMRDDWKVEIDLLTRAVGAASDAEAAELAGQFLAQRSRRRREHGLGPALADYERRLEWLEGLAKYVELTAWREASGTPGYEPLPALATDPYFKSYATFDQRWSQELGQMKRQATRDGEVRFYYTGMAQGVLLDRLMPDWKSRILVEDVWLEDLLAQKPAG